MLNMFDPKTLPTESGDPPDEMAIKATTNSGRVVLIAIRVKPTDVFPKRVIVETFTALPMTRLLAQFRATNEIAIIIMSSKN